MELTSKERAKLRRLGQEMEPIVWVGKAGIIPTIAQSAEEALIARELVKGKVQQESNVTAREAGEMLAEECQAVLVESKGRTFLLYRRNPKNPRILLED